jgi:hypothetical protein
MINGYCYTIQVKGPNKGSLILDANTMLAFDKYGIDMADVYQNAQDCQNNFGFNGPVANFSLNGADMKFNYPQCFWGASLPIFDINPACGRGDICGIVNPADIPSYIGTPECLGVTCGSCEGIYISKGGACVNPHNSNGTKQSNTDCSMNSQIKGGGCTLSVDELIALCNQIPSQQSFSFLFHPDSRGPAESYATNITTAGYATSLLYIPKINPSSPSFTIKFAGLCQTAIETCAGNGSTGDTRLGKIQIAVGSNYVGQGQYSDVYLQLSHVGESCNPGENILPN